MRTIIPPAPARYLVTAAETARRFAITAYRAAVCPIHGSELAAGRTGSQYVLAPVEVRNTAVRRNGETVFER
ncbi:MAG TPA: hypothetical protein VNP20_01855 [Nocardioidaceae bacterium]|nr:hypothetical protein [Nocardioidaceae bacterium]